MSKQGEKDASVDTHDLVLVTDASTQSSLIQKLTKVKQKLPSPTPLIVAITRMHRQSLSPKTNITPTLQGLTLPLILAHMKPLSQVQSCNSHP